MLSHPYEFEGVWSNRPVGIKCSHSDRIGREFHECEFERASNLLPRRQRIDPKSTIQGPPRNKQQHRMPSDLRARGESRTREQGGGKKCDDKPQLSEDNKG